MKLPNLFNNNYIDVLLLLQNEPIFMGQRDYRCPFCPKKSGTKQHMKYHIRIHTGEKPYSCDYCTYASKTKENLTKHISTQHNESSKFVS